MRFTLTESEVILMWQWRQIVVTMLDLKRAVLIVIAAFFVSNSQIFLSEHLMFFKPYYFYLPIILVAPLLLVIKTNDGYVIDSTKLVWWISGLIMLSFISAGFYNSIIPDIEQIKSNIWVLAVMLSFIFLVNSEDDRASGLLGIYIGTLMVGLSVYGELLTDFDFYRVNPEHGGRLSGLYTNPNTAGLVLVLGGFLGQFHLQTKQRLYLYAFIGGAVFLTVSRSAMLLFFTSFVFSCAIGVFGRIQVTRVVLFSAFFLMAFVLVVTGRIITVIDMLGLSSHFSESILSRISASVAEQNDASAMDRMGVLKLGLGIYAQNPIFGLGLGSSSILQPFAIGPHNMFVRLMIEMGSVGLLYFLSLVFVASTNRISVGFLLLFFVSCLFNHTNLDYVVFAILLPMGLTMMRNSPKMTSMVGLPRYNFKKTPSMLRVKLVRKMNRVKILRENKESIEILALKQTLQSDNTYSLSANDLTPVSSDRIRESA